MSDNIPAREAYGLALRSLGSKFKDFVVLEGDLSASTRTVYFAEAFQDRFIDCGISEMNMMGMASGLAASGVLPIVNTFSIFSSLKTCEQVRTFICYPNLNVKIVSTHAGLDVGEAGVTHQAIEDVAIFRSFPNMKIISPADSYETASALEYMLTHIGPMYLRLGRSDLPVIHDNNYKFELGKAELLSDGSDLTIIGTGITVGFALDARRILQAKGMSVGVVNMSSLKPVDKLCVENVAKKSKLIVTVEDHNIIGGLGSAVLEVLADKPCVPVLRVGLQDVFGESGKPAELFSKYKIDGIGIVSRVEDYLSTINL